MMKNNLVLVVAFALTLMMVGRPPAQCQAFSTATFTSYGSACQPTGPAWCMPNLYGFYGSCSVSLALVGSSATFRLIGIGTQAGSGSTLLPLGGGACPLWIDSILVVMDVSGLGLTQVTFPAPAYSIVGLTLHVQAVYSVDCGPAGTHLGMTQAVALTFN
jgi:hypothetical protein